MIWGTFSNTHIATLVLALVFIFILFRILVNQSRKFQILSLFVLSLALAAIVVHDALTSNQLPLHWWSLSALILPYAVLTRNQSSCNLLLLWPVQSLIVLVFNYDMADVNVLTTKFALYWITHVLIFSIPLLLFWLKLVKRDAKYIKRSIVISALTYTAVHFINIAFDTNYLYSTGPGSNSVLLFLRTILPFEYWYMYALIPAAIVYLFWWYLPEILDRRRKTKHLKQKLKVIDRYYDEYEDEYIDEIIEEKYG